MGTHLVLSREISPGERPFKEKNMILKITLSFIAIIFLWLVFVYNKLIRLKNQVKEAWADIEVQLKRRHNLIPNLVETVKGYAWHEKEVLTKVTEARSKAIKADSLEEKAKAENFLTQTLKSLFAVAENYPQLKASQNFLLLQKDLTDSEDKIQAARRFYNGNVRDYNIALEKFPNNLIVKFFSFKKYPFFETEEEAREVPKVKF